MKNIALYLTLFVQILFYHLDAMENSADANLTSVYKQIQRNLNEY